MRQVVNQVPDPDEAHARAGMFAPEPVLVREGSYLYRFASHDVNFGYHASPWWIRQKDFDEIVRRAERSGVDLGSKARWDLAVLSKWGSKMNVAVEARVCGRLWAWTGLAKPQLEETPNGKAVRLYGHRGIKQLYLCGVVERFRVTTPQGDVEERTGILTPLGRRALGVTGAKIIPSAPIF